MRSLQFTKGTPKNEGFSLRGLKQRGVSRASHGVHSAMSGSTGVSTHYRPKSGRYDSILKNRGKLLHKNSFLKPQAYREGLCFIHKVKMLGTRVRGSASPGRRNEKNLQTDFNSFGNSVAEEYPRDSIMCLLERLKRQRKERNLSQQTMIVEEIPDRSTYQSNARDHETVMPFRTYKKIQKTPEHIDKIKSMNITGWENDLEWLRLN